LWGLTSAQHSLVSIYVLREEDSHLILSPGISFALSNAADFKDIHPWMKYPGSSSHGGEHFEKAPSVVALASENPELTENAWGYQVEPGMKSYSWIKLLLDNSALPTEYDDPELKKAAGSGILRLPQGMSAKDVVTEFLRGMNRMFEDAVTEITGNNKTIPVDFWLTVPATWSEKAKILTKQAAMDAGFGTRPIDRIFLIPEPEAGAHLALKSSIHHVEDLILVIYFIPC
jgi:molecular chaperone DnaK (HSP70)